MSRVANAVLGALLFLVLVVGAYLQQGPGGPGEDSSSVFSKGPNGRSVAIELLSDLGFQAQAWTLAPAELPQGAAMLFVSEAPRAPEHYAVVEPEADAPASERELIYDRAYDPVHYRSFVEQGGTLVLSAGAGEAEFLEQYFGLQPRSVDSPVGEDESLPVSVEEFADEMREADEDFSRAVSHAACLEDPVETRLWSDEGAGPEEEVRLTWCRTPEFERPERLQTLAADSEGAWLVAGTPLGEGWLVILESDHALSNQAIEAEQNALFLVRLVERFADQRQVLFDEYTLGGWTPESPLELAFSQPARPLTLHLIALLACLLWLSAWVRWFPRDPKPLGAVSAQMRARGMASLLSRKKRWDLLAEMLQRGVLRRLARRTGMGRELLEGDQEELRSPERLRKLLAPLVGGQGASNLEHALALFSARGLNSKAELESLALELADLEQGIMNRNAETDRASE